MPRRTSFLREAIKAEPVDARGADLLVATTTPVVACLRRGRCQPGGARDLGRSATRRSRDMDRPAMICSDDWLEPWKLIGDERKVLERELGREVCWRHPLHRQKAEAIGRRIDNDDVLFRLKDWRYAVVHLTWRRERSEEWPWTIFFDDLERWRSECMVPDNQEYARSRDQESSRDSAALVTRGD